MSFIDKSKIAPFFWVDYDEDSASVCLDAGGYKDEIFAMRADEGFEGSGYDWNSLAIVFLEEKASELKGSINLDSEAGMFCAYSSNKGALAKFAIAFKNMCEDEETMKDLFSRAELD